MKSLIVLHDEGTSRTSFLFGFPALFEREASSTRTRGGVLIVKRAFLRAPFTMSRANACAFFWWIGEKESKDILRKRLARLTYSLLKIFSRNYALLYAKASRAQDSSKFERRLNFRTTGECRLSRVSRLRFELQSLPGRVRVRKKRT